jgi:hypothetical protein
MRFLVAAVGQCLGIALLLPGLAGAAPTASVTRAVADSTWGKAHVTGSVSCADCAGSSTYVRWTPIVTVQPSLPAYQCRGDEWADSDPNTRVLWGGGEQTGNASVPFDLRDAPILTGVFGQRLCVLVVHISRYREPLCLAQAPILGLDPNVACPPTDHIVDSALTSSILTVEAPQPPQTPVVEAPSPAAPDVDTSEEAPATTPVRPLSVAEARVKALQALRKTLGRRWTRGIRKRLTCQRGGTSQAVSCRARWRYRGRAMTRRVNVGVDGAKVRALVRP